MVSKTKITGKELQKLLLSIKSLKEQALGYPIFCTNCHALFDLVSIGKMVE